MGDQQRGTGFIADPHMGMYRSFRASHPGASKSLPLGIPDSVSLLNFAPPIQDQDGIGECVGRAVTSALFCVLGSKGAPPRALFSCRAAYNLARAIDRAALYRSAADLPPLVDSGCSPNQCIRAIGLYGLADVLDIDGGIIDAQPDKKNQELHLGELCFCDNRRTPEVTWTAIADDDPDKLALVIQALATGNPVVYAVDAGTPEFQQYDGGEPLLLSPEWPDHMQYAIGYQDKGRLIRGVNSWSRSWGDGGYYWIDSTTAAAGMNNILIPRYAP